MKILVTGANGFIGRPLCNTLLARGFSVRGTTRLYDKSFRVPNVDFFAVGNVGAHTDWQGVLEGIDTVVHLAAKVHTASAKDRRKLEEFIEVNTRGSEQLARSAAKAGVHRFIYLSTVKVNGEETGRGIFAESDTPNPTGPYAISKCKAEQALFHVAEETGIETVVLRPPLVYGPGVRANFLKLIDIVTQNVYLPFGLIDNCRSFVYVGNLIDAITTCITHPNAPAETFFVSDDKGASTPDVMRMIASAMRKDLRLVPLPPLLLGIMGSLIGRGAEVKRITGSLRITNDKIRNILGWKPPFTLEEGIYETVRWYQAR